MPNIHAKTLKSEFQVDEYTLALWHFNEGSGQIVQDASSHHNDGTLGPTADVEPNDPSWATGFTDQLGDFALSMDDWYDYALLPDNPDNSLDLNLSNQFTIEFWTYIRQVSRAGRGEGNHWNTFMNKRAFQDWTGYAMVQCSYYPLLQGYFYDLTSGSSGHKAEYLPPSTLQWTHVMLVYDGVFLELHYDGVLQVRREVGSYSVAGNGQPLTIGKALTEDAPWTDAVDAVIDEVRISSVARIVAPTRVLHVSAFSLNEVQQLIDIAQAYELFEITQVALSDFNAGTPANLSAYDVIVFGISNRYETGNGRPGTIGRISELKNYVEEGGGLVWTHDSLETENDYGPEAEDLAGVDYGLPGTSVDVPLAKICTEHEVLHCPYEIGSVNDTVPVLFTHTWYGHVTNATIVLMSATAPADQYNFYLTLNEYDEGRVALIEIGDTVIDYDGTLLGWPSQIESRVFANTLYWVSRASADHDVAVLNIQPSKTVVGKGYSMNMSVPIANRGNYTESFNATVNATSTVIGTRPITLDGRHSGTLIFEWNTSSCVYGNYSLRALADQVPGETDTSNNKYTGGWVIVSIPGDINGDFTVDIYDAILLAGAYNSGPISLNWNPNGDITGDNIVDIYDAILLANHYNQHYP